jgi:ATP-dependent Clp protease ATP-binding subunit ClpC
VADKLERFTQRARRVLTLAQENAESMNHNYIGTEHLLLGLVLEESGVAGRVLRGMGLNPRRIQDLVERMAGTQGRRIQSSTELTPRTKRIIELAVDEALYRHRTPVAGPDPARGERRPGYLEADEHQP